MRVHYPGQKLFICFFFKRYLLKILCRHRLCKVIPLNQITIRRYDREFRNFLFISMSISVIITAFCSAFCKDTISLSQTEIISALSPGVNQCTVRIRNLRSSFTYCRSSCCNHRCPGTTIRSRTAGNTKYF